MAAAVVGVILILAGTASAAVHPSGYRMTFGRLAKTARLSAPAGPAGAPSTSPGLTFGIYPGGAAGGSTGSLPRNQAAESAAVEQLSPVGKPFVVHLYAEYYGPNSWTIAQEAGSQITNYAGLGIKVELVLCYRPADRVASTDVPGFIAWMQAGLKLYGKQLSYLQVTNEANVAGSAATSDGAFPGAETALVDGVIAAKQAAIEAGEAIRIGFNWAYQVDLAQNNWWSYLKTVGGAKFLAALDWVGLDVYPGTWGPALSSTLSFASGVGTETTAALQALRATYMPVAGIPATVPIHISEVGFPTGRSRTWAQQTTAMGSEIQAIYAARVSDNVTNVRWFDLRDATSASPDPADQYGLMTDTYSPKPAFGAFAQLVSQMSSSTPLN